MPDRPVRLILLTLTAGAALGGACSCRSAAAWPASPPPDPAAALSTPSIGSPSPVPGPPAIVEGRHGRDRAELRECGGRVLHSPGPAALARRPASRAPWALPAPRLSPRTRLHVLHCVWLT
jgi:hypothetical protein